MIGKTNARKPMSTGSGEDTTTPVSITWAVQSGSWTSSSNSSAKDGYSWTCTSPDNATVYLKSYS